MNISIIYHSETGNTKKMAEVIAEGMKKVDGVEVGVFSFDNIDENFVANSSGVVFGTPTYLASMSWQMKQWLDLQSSKMKLAGKLGGCFATARFAQGGADTALQMLHTHLLVRGMLCYSGGGAFGMPIIHMGPVALKENFQQSKEMFSIFGERFAKKAMELF